VADLVLVRSMTLSIKTIDYGGKQVPLISRPWKSLRGARDETTRYYRIEIMKSGQSWLDMAADASCGYSEHYVALDGKPLPVGVMIARELEDEGAIIAVCTDGTMDRYRFVNTNLICVEPAPPLSEVLDELRTANGGSFRGLPDAVGIFPDGRVALREAKLAKKDRLNKNQHSFAIAARRVLGTRLDLAVVEWGYNAAEKT
jgi:hypothetical protein